jgi:hypothetical protein
MSKLSPLAITSIAFGSLIGGIIIYELANSKSKSKSKSKKTAQFPSSNSDALKQARETLSSITPEVSRSEIISAISNSKFLKTNGGSRRRCKKGGKRKTKGRK